MLKPVTIRVAGMETECKVAGNLIRVDKGNWDNDKQDWYARLTFDSGVVVETPRMYSEF